MNRDKRETTRRAVVAALAATPIAGLPAVAVAMATPSDPIVAALAAVASARAAYEQEIDGDAQSAAFDAIGEAEVDLYATKPATPAGASKLLRFIADFLDQDDVINDILVGDMIGDAIRSAVDVFEREARS